MPGEGPTHGPPAEKKYRRQTPQAKPINRHSLRDSLNAYTQSAWCAGLLATIRDNGLQRTARDTSIGVSARCDFTSTPSRSSAHPCRTRCGSIAAIAPRLACRDDRDTPSARGGLGPADIKFRKNERRMFPCCRLDSSHGLEPECKIRVLPHAPFVLETAEQTRGSASDGPTGDSLARQVPKRVVRRPRRRAWVVSRRQGWRETCSD